MNGTIWNGALSAKKSDGEEVVGGVAEYAESSLAPQSISFLHTHNMRHTHARVRVLQKKRKKQVRASSKGVVEEGLHLLGNAKAYGERIVKDTRWTHKV